MKNKEFRLPPPPLSQVPTKGTSSSFGVWYREVIWVCDHKPDFCM